jgi:hypothetical protein
MASFCLDGSALAKRYVPEPGSALVDYILDNVPEDRIYLLNIGAAEVISVLVRKRNAGTLSVADFSQAITELESEVIQSRARHLLSFDMDIGQLPYDEADGRVRQKGGTPVLSCWHASIGIECDPGAGRLHGW